MRRFVCMSLASYVALLVASSAASAHSLRVGRAMPVVGSEVALSVRWGGPALPDGTRVAFRAERPAGMWQAAATVADGRAEAAWTPAAPGLYDVVAEANGTELGRQTVFAVVTPVHINHWTCAPTQRYVTSVLDNGDGTTAEQWRDRGVLPLNWAGGQCDFATRKTAEAFAKAWAEPSPGRAGIMIDEFGGGGEQDEVMGEALTLLRASSPGTFIAPYCVGVSGTKMIKGFARSDLVLAEVYVNDWRGYGVITGRAGPAVAVGLGDHTIAVLGLQQWITTETELRAQVAYTRSELPELPGIGFFPNVPDYLADAVDRAVYDYFLGPALLVRDDAVWNIGQLPAIGVRIASADGGERALPPLDPGAREPLRDGESVLRSEGYTLVEYHSPVDAAPPTADESQAALQFEADTLGEGGGRAVDLGGIAVDRLPQDDKRAPGCVSGASVPITSRAGKVGLAFDITFGKAYFYGTVGMSVAGDGRLSVSFNHGDQDHDIAPDQPRAEFTVLGPGNNGRLTRLVCPLGLRTGETYHVFVGCDGSGVLACIRTARGEVIWQSGRVPCGASPTVDRLRAEVSAFEGSDVAPQPDGSLSLRGVSGGPKPSPYVLEATVTGVRVAAG